jgi:hypothetical protein
MKRRLMFDSLETKALPGACMVSPPFVFVSSPPPMQKRMPIIDAPGEDDPGELPIDDTPIVLPPVPPSGPVGPG